MLYHILCYKGLEDLQRARSDRDENNRYACYIVLHFIPKYIILYYTISYNRKVTIVKFTESGETEEIETETRLIQAGDIIKLSGHTSVPADMILFLTSNYADANNCYIETANIDGETNLKLREAPAYPALRKLATQGKPSLEMFKVRRFFSNFLFFSLYIIIHNYIYI